MQRRAEAEMNEKTPSEDIYGWFRTRKPSTGVGAFHLTRALLSDRRVAEAEAVARRAWVELNMNRRLETQFQKRYQKLLRPEDHIARLDRLLWDRGLRAHAANCGACRMITNGSVSHELL